MQSQTAAQQVDNGELARVADLPTVSTAPVLGLSILLLKFRKQA
ncbi:hypothetical protein EVAR_58024_1, partial [Eumeta japonica]